MADTVSIIVIWTWPIGRPAGLPYVFRGLKVFSRQREEKYIYLKNTRIIKTIKNQEFFLKLVYLNSINISIPVPYFHALQIPEGMTPKPTGNEFWTYNLESL
jgi:hypothetical protein